MSTNRQFAQRAGRGKYHRLFAYLTDLSSAEWRTTFGEIESILGFDLPPSARRYRPWWANETGKQHSHALAWNAAGWETAEVDMAAETLLLRRKYPGSSPKSRLDELWPVHSAGGWPEGLSLRREDIYEDRIHAVPNLCCPMLVEACNESDFRRFGDYVQLFEEDPA